MANYAYVENGTIKELYDNLPINWKNISNFYILTDEEVEPLGWRKIIKPTVQFDSATQKIGNIDYYVLGDDVYERTEILPIIPTISPDTIASNILVQWELVRKIRDGLMDEFQWRYIRYERQVRLGLPTVDDLTNMDTYMQALADITTQEDPFNIVWPEYVN